MAKKQEAHNFDMDSTLIQTEVIDETALEHGVVMRLLRSLKPQ